MSINVKFLQGTPEGYAALTTKESTTFYFTGTDLYLGTIKLSSAGDLASALTRLGVAETDIDNLETAIGSLEGLTTTAKTNLVAAINEVVTSISTLTTNSAVTLESSTTDPDYAKVYTIKQGGTSVGTINIPKDMVVSSGQVVVNPQGQPAGTYIELTLANATNDKIYVNVGTLIDIYTAQQNATQVQLTIDPSTRVISASIVAGSIGATELATDAVTTVKIADGNVTKAKLASAVQSSLDAADSAIQSVAEGSTNGTVAVDGTDVAVHGLGTAAYTASTAYDAAGAASTAEQNAKDYTDAALTWGTFPTA